MQLLVRIAVGYFLAATLVVALFRDDPLALVGEILQSIPASLNFFVMVAGSIPLPGLLGAGALLLVLMPRQGVFVRLSRGVLAIFACTGFYLTFAMLKTSLPFILPFWADPMLTQLDSALHLGHAPWALTHALSGWLDAGLMATIYFKFWVTPATFLPALLLLLDPDAARIRRFTWLYAFVWIGLGNVLALAFLSAGPVYRDRLLGGETFAGLATALDSVGVNATFMGAIYERLWQSYASAGAEAGSGISAFPSVHLGMATVIALYLFERWRFLAPVSLALVATYQFLSVYLGWHYAVDGYASILLVGLVWALLRRRAGAGDEAGAGALGRKTRRMRAPEASPIAAE
ncbi:MAG TPA: hypothetical protein ENK83_00150 [Aliiroseovarius sp.]|nr:hypothetical protein [Aliiroseovarius sp.]